MRLGVDRGILGKRFPCHHGCWSLFATVPGCSVCRQTLACGEIDVRGLRRRRGLEEGFVTRKLGARPRGKLVDVTADSFRGGTEAECMDDPFRGLCREGKSNSR